MVRSFLILPLVLMLAQKPVKKPEVHADFYFGSYPWSRTAADLLKEDLAREIVVAYAQGWSVDWEWRPAPISVIAMPFLRPSMVLRPGIRG